MNAKFSLDFQRNTIDKKLRSSGLLGFKQLCHFLKNHYNEPGIHFTLAPISNNKEYGFQEYVLFIFLSTIKNFFKIM